MLIAAIAIWLILLVLALAFCRAAASADSKDPTLSARYPSRIASLHPHPSLRQERGPSLDRHGARTRAVAHSER
jgi:hypothetical protein